MANPVLEGATRDLAAAVALLREGSRDQRVDALLIGARLKIDRATARLSAPERRAVSRAWKVVERASRGA